MVKYLIIPDVHGRSFWKAHVNYFLENHQEAKIIFLGDYVDPYQYEGISPEEAFIVLEEIIELKRKYSERIVLLIGNHDLHYLHNHSRGCRMDYERKSDLHGLFNDNKDLFNACLFDKINNKNIIFSHAGFTKEWINWHIGDLCPEWHEKHTGEEIYENIDFEFLKSIDWNKKLFEEMDNFFAECSFYRGGYSQFSSFMWTDLEEMIMSTEHINAIQIFGHSQQENDPVNYKDYLYCIDCRKPFIMNENAEITYIDGEKIEENGTVIEERYRERAKQMLKYAGFFL